MKKITTVLILFIALTSRSLAQSNSGDQVAINIAQKMKDSLGLSEDQRQQIYTVNMQLNSQKSLVWQQSSQSDSLRVYLQQVENTRDSLYMNILDSDKYVIYQLKKTSLVSND